MTPLIVFLARIIDFIALLILVSAVFSWLIAFGIINFRTRGLYEVAETLRRLTEPMLRPIRRRLPDFGGVDVSPLVLLLILYFIKDVIFVYILRIFP
jgi:YggT family protein